jgi:hypothetical protein
MISENVTVQRVIDTIYHSPEIRQAVRPDGEQDASVHSIEGIEF